MHRAPDSPTLEARLETRRAPSGPHAMVQSWHDLLFLHWQWEPRELEAHLPSGLHLDTHDGRAWLGLVPFRMRGVRSRSAVLSAGTWAFLELNVRTYVFDETGTPGVWFHSLDAASALAVHAARLLYGLPYHRARMSVRWDADGVLEYGSRRLDGRAATAWFRYRGVTNTRRVAQPGSLEFFLVERYVLFAFRGGRLRSARVNHAPYPIEDAELFQWSTWPLALDGFERPPRVPDSVLYSPGVDVRVWSPVKSR